MQFTQKPFFLLFLVLVVLILGPNAQCRGADKDDVDSRKTIEELVSNITAYFDQIQSIEYDYTRSKSIAKTEIAVSVHWKEKGNLFLYDWIQHDSPELTESDAYDGQHYQFIWPSTNNLVVGKKRSPRFGNGRRLVQDLLFTAPFQWLHPPEDKNKADLLTVPFFRSLNVASIVRSSVEMKAVTINSRECVELSLPGAVDYYQRVPYTYKVYFSIKDNYFPIGWDTVDAADKIISQYRITELGKIATASGQFFYYPKTATLGWFGESGSNTTDVVQTFRITNFSLNSLSDDNFTIDPSTANSIQDMDTNMVIMVPH